MNRKPYVNEDAQLHMSATYKRNSKPKRSFSLVIKGIMLSSVMLGTIAATGIPAFAASLPDLPTHPSTVQASQQFHEDQLVLDLRTAVKAMEELGWSKNTMQAILNKLHEIDVRLGESNDYRLMIGLDDAISDAKFVVAKHGGDGLTELRGTGNSISETIQSIETKMGLTQSSNNAPSPPVHKKSEVRIASVVKNEVTVVIDGQTQTFPQPAVMKDGRTLVPLRGMFEALGAKVTWNNVSQTATGTKDDIEVIVQINNKTAYINNKAIELDVPAQIIKDSTMVPLRFVSESLGASVDWDGSTRTAYINSEGVTVERETQIVNGIEVRFGKHTYGSRNQEEYDTSLRIVEDALLGYDEVVFGGRYNEYYELYLKGERWSGDRTDRSDRNRGLKAAEGSIGDLVSAGVSRDTIIKVYKTMEIIRVLAGEKSDPKDGSPKSAYDNLVLGNSDCDALAEVYSLGFDIMGFNTAIIEGSNHAEVLIQIDGNWYRSGSGTFRILDVTQALKSGSSIFSQPTYGSILN